MIGYWLLLLFLVILVFMLGPLLASNEGMMRVPMLVYQLRLCIS